MRRSVFERFQLENERGNISTTILFLAQFVKKMLTIIEWNGKCESLKSELKIMVVLMNVRSIKSKVSWREKLKYEVE